MIMKKLFVFATLCFGMFTVANAQEDYAPDKGDFAVELGFSPFYSHNGGTFSLDDDAQLKLRWFFSDKNALRLKIGFGFDNTTRKSTESFDPTIKKTTGYDIFENTTETKSKNTNFSFMLGYERHLFTQGRFDVYAGLELGYGLTKYSGSETYEGRTDSYDKDGKLQGYSITINEKDYTDCNPGGAASSNVFKGNLFAGVDVYVWKNLYLGAELGLGFNTGKNRVNTYYSFDNNTTNYDEKGAVVSYEKFNYDGEANTTTIETYDGSKTETFTINGEKSTTTLAPTSSITPTGINTKRTNETTNTGFKLYVEPAIRIGWKF
jgi:hypothetical protein